MALAWSGYSNRLRAGIGLSANRNPTQADPNVTISVAAYGQTDYSTYNYDLTMSYSGSWGSSTAVKRASGSNALLMVGPASRVVTASYDDVINYSFSCTVSGTGAGPVSYSRTATIPRRPTANPGVPTNVTLTPAVGAGKLTLNFNGPSAGWPGPTSGRRYYWQISTQSNFATTTSTGYQTGGTLNISGSAGVRYYVRVRSEGVWWDATRTSAWVTVNALAPAVPTLSSTPAAQSISRNSWVVPTAQIANNGGQAPTNYRVMVNTTPTDTTNIAESGGWVARPVTGATPDTLYYYKVSAYNYAGWGPWTEWATVRTLDDAPSDPAPPTVTDLTEVSATVTWVAPSPNGATITGYTLVIAETDNPGVPVQTHELGPTELSKALTGLSKARDYWAFVRAKGTPSNSGFSTGAPFRTTGTLATMFPMINQAGTWKKFELWERQGGTWKKVQLQLNHQGVWKWSEL